MAEETFRFQIEIDIPDLDKYSPFEESIPCELKYDAELVLKMNNNHEVLLRIYYDVNEDLDYKLFHFEDCVEKFQSNEKEELLDKFLFKKGIDPLTLINLNFDGFRWKKIGRESVNDFNVLEIKTTGVNLTFATSKLSYSVFYLNKESFDLIECNFGYKSNSSILNEDYQWVPIQSIKEYLKFDRISYKPDFKIYNSTNTKEKVTITKAPIIKIPYNNLSYEEIKNYIKALCSLFSFYSGRNIDYHYSEIYSGKSRHVDIKNIPNSYSDYYHDMFTYEIRNPVNLITSVNSEFFMQNVDFMTNCIRRFNTALQLEGESKFMLLYNVIEQIRNHYVKAQVNSSGKKVIESYKFINRKEANESIKSFLKNISELVVPELKMAFIKEIDVKTKEIKRLKMKSQFESLFCHLNINPSNYHLNFKELFDLRNKIFHGHPVSNIEILEQINNYKCLPKFTGMVILKFMGIDSLKDIKKF